ncbi:MAG: hypothetical protein WCE30_08200 [Mycobacterium sp.]
MSLPVAAADPSDNSAPVSTSADGSAATAPVAVSPQLQSATITSADADPAAVAACSQFAEALDAASDGYGSYADSLDDRDGTASTSNAVGRSSLRESASAAMDAANTPGLSPAIGDPMRAWSMGAAKLMVKVSLNMTGDALDSTAAEVNNNAEAVQKACAAAGTHA